MFDPAVRVADCLERVRALRANLARQVPIPVRRVTQTQANSGLEVCPPLGLGSPSMYPLR